MVLVPFVFFTCMCLFLWRLHKGIDVSVYMAALYALTTLFGIIVVLTDNLGQGGILFDNHDAEFNVIPTILFCLTIGTCILPFTLIYKKDVKRITLNAPWAVDMLSWMLIALAMLNLYLVAESTMDILGGDLGAIRNEHYAGAETPAQIKSETLPFILRFFYYFCPATILALPIFFYNICFRKKSIILNALLLFASLTCPIAGIQVADRTEFVYLAQMLVFCLIFFHKFFTKTIKRWLLIIGIPIVVGGVVYVTMVSTSRFEKGGGQSTSIRNLQYAGQGYLNFCYFYENGNNDHIAPEREFPLVNHFFYNIDSNGKRRGARMHQQGFFMSVFACFTGDIMLDLGVMGMLTWIVFYFLLAMLVIRRAHREEFDLGELLVIYMLAIVPIFGVFYYRFFSFSNTFTLMLVTIVYLLSRYKIIYK